MNLNTVGINFLSQMSLITRAELWVMPEGAVPLGDQ